MTVADAVALLERLLPIVVFLLAITVTAELEPVAADAAPQLMALLVGVNAGPLTPWALLATLLWLQRCRTPGIVVPWRWLVPTGALCAVIGVGAGVSALALTT